MKNPEEYLESFNILKYTKHHDYTYLYNKINEAIKQAQIDAYNQALEDTIDNVNFVETTGKPEIYNESPSMSNDMGDVFSIDKQSILKLKK